MISFPFWFVKIMYCLTSGLAYVQVELLICVIFTRILHYAKNDSAIVTKKSQY